MPDPLLGPLADTPLPPLTPAALVRGRGEVRRRRRRAAVAGAGALALVLAGTVAAGLVTGGDPDALRPLPPAASTAPEQSDPTPAGVPAALLVDAETVAQVRGGTWSQPQPDLDDQPFPFVTPCPEGGPGARAGRVRRLAGRDEPTEVLSQVLAYEDAASAQTALATLVEEVERCPRRGPDPEDTSVAEHELLTDLDGSSDSRVYGTVRVSECADCPERQHFSISQVGRYLTLVRLVGGFAEELPPLADAAEQRVRCATSQCPPPAARPRNWDVQDGFLRPEEATAAELPGWREVPGDRGRPILDPCGKGGTPLAEDVLDSDTTALGAEREAGESSLVQQVLRYRSAAQAAAAFEQWSERVRTCPRSGDVAWSVPEGGRTKDSDQMAVRRVPCQGDTCSDQLATYVLVARVGDGLTLVRYEIAEDGDPAEHVRPLLIAVVDRLRAAARG